MPNSCTITEKISGSAYGLAAPVRTLASINAVAIDASPCRMLRMRARVGQRVDGWWSTGLRWQGAIVGAGVEILSDEGSGGRVYAADGIFFGRAMYSYGTCWATRCTARHAG